MWAKSHCHGDQQQGSASYCPRATRHNELETNSVESSKKLNKALAGLFKSYVALIIASDFYCRAQGSGQTMGNMFCLQEMGGEDQLCFFFFLLFNFFFFFLFLFLYRFFERNVKVSHSNISTNGGGPPL